MIRRFTFQAFPSGLDREHRLIGIDAPPPEPTAKVKLETARKEGGEKLDRIGDVRTDTPRLADGRRKVTGERLGKIAGRIGEPEGKGKVEREGKAKRAAELTDDDRDLLADPAFEKQQTAFRKELVNMGFGANSSVMKFFNEQSPKGKQNIMDAAAFIKLLINIGKSPELSPNEKRAKELNSATTTVVEAARKSRTFTEPLAINQTLVKESQEKIRTELEFLQKLPDDDREDFQDRIKSLQALEKEFEGFAKLRSLTEVETKEKESADKAAKERVARITKALDSVLISGDPGGSRSIDQNLDGIRLRLNADALSIADHAVTISSDGVNLPVTGIRRAGGNMSLIVTVPIIGAREVSMPSEEFSAAILTLSRPGASITRVVEGRNVTIRSAA